MILFLLFLSFALYGSDNEGTITVTMNPLPRSPAFKDISTVLMSSKQMCVITLNNYFKGMKEDKCCECIVPYLQQRIESSKSSDSEGDYDIFVKHSKELKHSESSDLTDSFIESHIPDRINKLVQESMLEALKAKQAEADHHRQISRERITKPKVALIAGVTTIVTAAITAGVTLAIHFSDKS